MKKTLMFIAVLLLATPALADVAITCSSDGDTVTVSYDATSETNRVRAFALDISVSAGVITEELKEERNADYKIYPGSFWLDGGVPDGNIVAGPPFLPPATKGGLGTAAITIECGSLYASGSPAPAKQGDLLKFKVSETCTVTIVANTIRSGPIVMEDPDEEVDVSMTGCEVTLGCVYCAGDLTHDGWITTDDLYVMLDPIINSAPDYYFECPWWRTDVEPTEDGCICGDIAQDGWITTDDLYVMLDPIINAAPDYYFECYDWLP